jgi:hypothetical protein
VGVRPDDRIAENPRVIDRLSEFNFLRGLDVFRSLLRPSIGHPAAVEARPDRALLRRGMELRNFPADLIM